MDMFTSNLSEIDQLNLQVESLKRLIELQDERHRLAIIAAENYLNLLRNLYGDVL